MRFETSDRPPSHAPGTTGLGASARASLLWGGGSQIARDVVQFATMLVLVRLLSPTDYGSMAFAQSLVGLMAVVSFGTFVQHALQLRNPDDVDWQAHFTAAALINTGLFALTLGASAVVSHYDQFSASAYPLALLSISFLVEIAASLRHRMLQVDHDWARFRVLILAGTVLGSVGGISIALLGGGVAALAIQPSLFGLPAAVDLFACGWRPDLSWSWARYRDTAMFGLNRIGSGFLGMSRQAGEQSLIAGSLDFGALGIFTRSNGLATLIAGRIGVVVGQALYPIITRAKPRSEQFRRYASLVVRGVIWITVPAAAFLALEAREMVLLLYGPRWEAVATLLPLACIFVATTGIGAVCYQLLLANECMAETLYIDLASATGTIVIAFFFVKTGLDYYLFGMLFMASGNLLFTLWLLVRNEALTFAAVVAAFLPSLGGTALAWLVTAPLRDYKSIAVAQPTSLLEITVNLLVEGMFFGVVFVAVIRLSAGSALKELIDVLPGSARFRKSLLLPTRLHK